MCLSQFLTSARAAAATLTSLKKKECSVIAECEIANESSNTLKQLESLAVKPKP